MKAGEGFAVCILMAQTFVKQINQRQSGSLAPRCELCTDISPLKSGVELLHNNQAGLESQSGGCNQYVEH